MEKSFFPHCHEGTKARRKIGHREQREFCFWLRREFYKYRNWKRPIPSTAKRILVTLGGSDPDNVTRKVISAIEKIGIEGIEVKVIIGANNPHLADVKKAVQNLTILQKFMALCLRKEFY